MTQILAVHGIATLDWDSGLLPDRFWEQVARLPNGCWVPKNDKWAKPRSLREMAVARITDREPLEIWSAVPTCGNARCVNPAHVCVVMQSPLSVVKES